jgi:hypothetical protein
MDAATATRAQTTCSTSVSPFRLFDRHRLGEASPRKIDYLREENRVLREELGPRPLRLTDDQRHRLAVRGKQLGRRALVQVAGVDTGPTSSLNARKLWRGSTLR